MLTKRDHPAGLLVYLTNLPASAAKSSIATLISRHVDKHFRGLHEPLNQEGTVFGDQLGRSTPAANSTPDSVSLSIKYTDYTPGTTTATIRLASATDADKVVVALAADCVSRSTKDGCVSCGDADKQGSGVKAELVTGERERIYWEESIWKAKRGKKGKRRDGQKTSQAGFVYDDYNADVHDGDPQLEAKSAFEKDSGNLNLRTKGTREHIRFED
jgi:xRRM domain